MKKSKLEITAESLRKNKEILSQREQKLKNMITKEQANLFKQIAPNLTLKDILELIKDPEKVDKLKNAIDNVLIELFPIDSKAGKNGTKSTT